jgi:hypothetical protein
LTQVALFGPELMAAVAGSVELTVALGVAVAVALGVAVAEAASVGLGVLDTWLDVPQPVRRAAPVTAAATAKPLARPLRPACTP